MGFVAAKGKVRRCGLTMLKEREDELAKTKSSATERFNKLSYLWNFSFLCCLRGTVESEEPREKIVTVQ